MELTPQQRGRLPGTLQDWAEELFCDLFGVDLLGPSFVFASIELFDLGSLWSPDAELNQEGLRSYTSHLTGATHLRCSECGDKSNY